MENIIFNELLHRGYAVDVGVIEARVMKDGKSEYKQYEVDFIATNGNEKYYIQSDTNCPPKQNANKNLTP